MRILIADDHALVRRGLRDFLADQFTDAVIAEARDASEALDHLARAKWDVALLDISMPGMNGLELLKEMKQRRPQLPVLILSAHPEDQFALRVLKAGASGYMTKESAPEHIVTAIRKALAGGRYVSESLAERLAVAVGQSGDASPHQSLSDREFEVFRLIASGKTVSEIASDLDLSVKTVSTYRTRILEKMNMKNNAELTHYAVTNGLVG